MSQTGSELQPATSEIRQLPSFPVLGHSITYLRDPFEFITRSARQGRIVQWTFPGRTIYQLNDPADIEQVLVHRNQDFVKGALFRRIVGSINDRGLLVTEGNLWRRQRSLINPAFHPDRLAAYTDSMTRMTGRAIERWQDGERRDVHDDMMQLTLEIVASVLFGIDIRRQATSISDALEVIMARSENPLTDIVPRWLPTPANRRFNRAVATVESIVSAIIEKRRADLGSDVVSALLDPEDEQDRLSDDQIRDQVMTLLLAGHETTALALTFTLYLLAQHPDVERRLLTEVREAVGDRLPTANDLPELSYTEQVVKESLRLYPPVHTIPRESATAVELAGQQFPDGTTFTMHQWTIHRDPRFYDDPLAFCPERWSDDLGEELPRFAYFPFGGGPRRCIGDRFATIEAQLLLATLVQNVHFELLSPPSLDLASTITSRPKDPIEMGINEREEPAPDQ